MCCFRVRISLENFRSAHGILRSPLLLFCLRSGAGAAWAQAYTWKTIVISGGGLLN
jgi:hypothetical protein